MWRRFWRRLFPVKAPAPEKDPADVCRDEHFKDHFCLDDECAPVLPGDRLHFCNRCSRAWSTPNLRVFKSEVEVDYLHDKSDDFQSDGTYTEEDDNDIMVTKSQPFDRRKKNARPT